MNLLPCAFCTSKVTEYFPITDTFYPPFSMSVAGESELKGVAI